MYFLACDESLVTLLRFIRQGIIPLIQIGVPILLIIFGMIDLGKAVVAGKEDEIKNAQKLLIKRAISAVAVFFVVTLVTIVFSLFSSSGTDSDIEGTNDWRECWQEAA